MGTVEAIDLVGLIAEECAGQAELQVHIEGADKAGSLDPASTAGAYFARPIPRRMGPPTRARAQQALPKRARLNSRCTADAVDLNDHR